MSRVSITLVLLVILSCSKALAGGSYDSPYSYGSVITPINIENVGIYNLVISLQFMNEPYDKKIYNSDEYRSYIKRLSVEWSDVAVDQVLNNNVQKLEGLSKLKASIKNEVRKLADSLKSKYSFDQNIEVVFSIQNFYLLDPKKY